VSTIEPGTHVAIHKTKQDSCAGTGRVVTYNKNNDSYTVKMKNPDVGCLDIPAGKVEMIDG